MGLPAPGEKKALSNGKSGPAKSSVERSMVHRLTATGSGFASWAVIRSLKSAVAQRREQVAEEGVGVGHVPVHVLLGELVERLRRSCPGQPLSRRSERLGRRHVVV